MLRRAAPFGSARAAVDGAAVADLLFRALLNEQLQYNLILYWSVLLGLKELVWNHAVASDRMAREESPWGPHAN